VGDSHVQPIQPLGPHVSPSALLFYRGGGNDDDDGTSAFPDDYDGALLVAHHGSQTRTPFIGFRVDVVRLNDSGMVRGGLASRQPGQLLKRVAVHTTDCCSPADCHSSPFISGRHHAPLPQRLPAEPGRGRRLRLGWVA
jgi:hypothetical protein